MAAVSVPQAPSALTPPSSSHGVQNSWSYSVPAQTENISHSKSAEYIGNRPPLSQTNGGSISHQNSRSELSQRRANTNDSTKGAEAGYLAPARVDALSRKDSSISDTGSAPDSLLELYGQNRSALPNADHGERRVNGDGFEDEEDPERSRWIHRDKLARIESQELQAAGIILPRARTQSRSSRRERSRDQQGNGARSELPQKRQRVGSLPTEEEEAPENNAWDLRLPGEAADDQGEMYRDVSGGAKGVSRIPVLKASPLPIPMQHLERGTPLKRKQSGSWGDDDSISYPKPRERSQSIKRAEEPSAAPTPAKRLASDNSPTKKTPRKPSAPANRATSTPQRLKTRAGGARDTSGQRPPTRSGDLGPSGSISKRPEGDPPWLATMYKPDPRLPPDQQLLPTVAKRLQQEQWEKEGKFGNTYDTSFRPLSDQGFGAPRSPALVPEPEATEIEKKPDEEHNSEWPLRGPRSPALSTGRPGTAGGTGSGSYSTMPKLVNTHGTGTPQGIEPLPSPKPPVRLPPPSEESKGGCGCCIIM